MAASFRSPTRFEIEQDWAEFSGGSPLFAALGVFTPEDVEGVLYEDADAGNRGLITWFADGDLAELVSVHADPPGNGIGARLFEHVESLLHGRGVTRLLVATTNDNVDAVRFYQRHGFRLVEVRLDHMDRVRATKPHVPLMGNRGVPLQDLWVLEKQL